MSHARRCPTVPPGTAKPRVSARCQGPASTDRRFNVDCLAPDTHDVRFREVSMALPALRRRLDDIAKITDAEWMASPSERKRKEREFQDRDRDRQLAKGLEADSFERFYGNKRHCRATRDSQGYVDDWLRKHDPEKVRLDYACRNGQYAYRRPRPAPRSAVSSNSPEGCAFCGTPKRNSTPGRLLRPPRRTRRSTAHGCPRSARQ